MIESKAVDATAASIRIDIGRSVGVVVKSCQAVRIKVSSTKDRAYSLARIKLDSKSLCGSRKGYK